ncbi:hypothetical protein PR048_003263 [Dryococelus australis]|uniref:NADPH:adrenodoxin oxidoreductase, mitochondrial n=1 Tax=Dryococelus australis TaxID=614101 RepID=A0ABQ9INH7_9NEOP|nr:hypothetical protein PR048_003263 [Dryococelus australis]
MVNPGRHDYTTTQPPSNNTLHIIAEWHSFETAKHEEIEQGQSYLTRSGPAGFYTAQQLLKVIGDVQVDIYDSMPVPFGLVRYGVAPDHPEVKNVIHTFTKVAHNPNVRFVGNVSIGRNVTLDELRQAYHAVHLTYGAEQDRELGVPGETLDNVLSARRVVGWYNGVPWDRNLRINLDAEVCAILGQGNVALDIARILLTPVDVLKKTDITEHALAALSESKVKKVVLIGRRGPLQVAFTIKEFREMLHLPGCRTVLNPQDFVGVRNELPILPRPRRRLTDLLCKTALDPPDCKDNAAPVQTSLHPIFFRTPIRFLPQKDNLNMVGGIELTVNRLEGPDIEHQKAVPTDEVDVIECGLAMRSIGYRSVKADPMIPFDDTKGRVKNSNGVVEPELFSSGCVRSGADGLMACTLGASIKFSELQLEHLEKAIKKEERIDVEWSVVGKIKSACGHFKYAHLSKVMRVLWGGVRRLDASELDRVQHVAKSREKGLLMTTTRGGSGEWLPLPASKLPASKTRGLMASAGAVGEVTPEGLEGVFSAAEELLEDCEDLVTSFSTVQRGVRSIDCADLANEALLVGPGTYWRGDSPSDNCCSVTQEDKLPSLHFETVPKRKQWEQRSSK